MKKGFTMAEMIGVVIILCVIALLAFPPILNLVKRTENDLDESTKQLVVTATTRYITKNINDFPKTKNNIYYVFIEDLLKEQLLSNSLIESSNLKLNSCVKISVNNNYKYEYNVEVTCSKEEEE